MDQVDSLNEIMSSALQSTPMTDVDVSRGNVASTAQVIAVAADLPSFQYFISEQAKSILALQELQNEVGALLEFRDLVMEAFPQLGQKVQNLQSQTALSASSKWEPGIRVKRKLGQQLRDPDMLVPSLLPRYRSNSQGKGSRSEISGSTTSSSAIQDSGFCTESSKDHLSAISSRSKSRETDDELSSLLDHIHHKGTRLKLEVEYLWSRLQREGSSSLSSTKRRCRSLDDLILTNNAQSFTYEKNAYLESELESLKRERDSLLKKMNDIESEHEAALANTSRLEEELENVSAEKRYLEGRLQDAIQSEGRPDDLQHNFLTRNQWRNVQTTFAKCQLLKLKQVFEKPDRSADEVAAAAHAIPPSMVASKGEYFRPPQPEWKHATYMDAAKIDRPSNPVTRELNANSYQAESHKTVGDGGGGSAAAEVTLASTKEFGDDPKHEVSLGKPDVLIGFWSGHPSSLDSSKREGVTLSKEKVLSILNEYSPKELRCFLLTLSYQVEALNVQVQRISKSRMNIFKQLSKYKCENEDLRLELKKKEIELEGTKAQKRMLEQKRDIKLSYSTSDLMSGSPKSCDTRADPAAFAYSVSDSALMHERASTPASIRSGVKCSDLRDHSDKAMKSGGSGRRSISKIPLKTYSSKLPTKLNSTSSNKKTLASFKDYSASGPSHSSCISSTSSSLNK